MTIRAPFIAATASALLLSLGDAIVFSAAAQTPTPVPCTEEREVERERIGPDGGVIQEKYARVVFPHGAYDRDTLVTMTPDPDYHGISISPVPKKPVLVLLRVDYCDTDEDDRFWLQAGTAPAADALQLDREGLLGWGKKWAGTLVSPDAFKPGPGQGLLQRGGFVILSN